jgi:hypothetical protein
VSIKISCIILRAGLLLSTSVTMDLVPPIRVTPQHNLMVAFPCSSRSHHSVSAITAQLAPRNYVQVHISSSEDIWPRAPVPSWRRALGSLKRHLRRN